MIAADKMQLTTLKVSRISGEVTYTVSMLCSATLKGKMAT